MYRMKSIIILALVAVFLFMIVQLPKPNKYIPTKAASGGLSPNGGMRDNQMEVSELKYPPIHYNDYEPYIYDSHGIPGPMIWKIGHWST